MSFCGRSFILADTNVVFFFVWISILYSRPTHTLSFILWSFKICLCTHMGFIINLSWLHFFSLSICIYYYLFFFFFSFNPAVAILYCHFLGLESMLSSCQVPWILQSASVAVVILLPNINEQHSFRAFTINSMAFLKSLPLIIHKINLISIDSLDS